MQQLRQREVKWSALRSQTWQVLRRPPNTSCWSQMSPLPLSLVSSSCSVLETLVMPYEVTLSHPSDEDFSALALLICWSASFSVVGTVVYFVGCKEAFLVLTHSLTGCHHGYPPLQLWPPTKVSGHCQVLPASKITLVRLTASTLVLKRILASKLKLIFLCEDTGLLEGFPEGLFSSQVLTLVIGFIYIVELKQILASSAFL